MNKINILDSSIFNRIAAGEVVERPYSVLKELLDNSIDAKASEIEIRVYEGGTKQIQVADNGSGIEYDDLPRVFLPHATSKIKSVDDLDKIGTLGFRGEALASIGAVSEVEVISKTNSCDYGGKLSISGGKNQSIEQIGAKNGTKVTVSNLFFNIPARAKFLKKPRQEASEITNLVARYILANPNIKIRYFLDDTEVYSSTGNGLFEAIYSVYGKTTTENILPINYSSSSGIKVSGYIGYPTFSKPNRTYQTLIVNGRYVQNSMVSLCVYNAFEHYLMKGQFPFYVININLPLDTVDVNVHPNKMDIRFENSNAIYGVVYQGIMNALNDHAKSVIEVNKKVYDYKMPASSGGVSFGDSNSNSTQKIEPVEIKFNNSNLSNNESTHEIANDSANRDTESPNFVKFYGTLAKDNTKFSQSNAILSNVFEKVSSAEQFENNKSEQVSTNQNQMFSKIDVLEQEKNIFSNEKKQETMFDSKSYHYVGTLFDTFVIVELDDDAFMIDQHAAHERLLYDKFRKQVNDREVSIQSLLVPYTFNVNNLEKQFIEDNLTNLSELGFDIAEFGSMTYKVSTIPSLLYGINLKTFFDEILAELSVFKQLKQADLIISKLMQHSCKTAIKAGDKLSQNEIECLINQMQDTNMQLQCPHGRPAVIKITKKEIEKWFKRIV